MALSTAQLWGGVEPVVRKFYGLERHRKKPVYKKIFKTTKGKEAVRHSMEMGGPGQLSLKTENGAVSSLSIRQGPNKTWNYDLYAGEITLSYELARDTRIREIETTSRSLGRATALTPENITALFLDRAFNSSFPAVADGKALCATDHLIVGTNASTGSNMLSGGPALSETSLEDVYTNLMSMPGPDGMISPLMPEKLVVPAGLALTGEKLTTKGKTLGSAYNDPKVVGHDLELVANPFLGSATRWFVLTDAVNGLFVEFDGDEENFMEDNSVTTLQKIYVAFFRMRHGCDDWRHVYGSNAS